MPSHSYGGGLFARQCGPSRYCNGDFTRVARPRSGGNSAHSGSMRYPRRFLRCPAYRICGTCGRHGSADENVDARRICFADDTVASSNGHVDTLPQTSVILGYRSRPKRERAYVVGSAISFGDAIASVGGGSDTANGWQKSTCNASSSNWPAQRSTGAQSSGRGITRAARPRSGGSGLPPSTDNGGDFYADSNSHVGASERSGSSFAPAVVARPPGNNGS
jgi:hypothetical protein